MNIDPKRRLARHYDVNPDSDCWEMRVANIGGRYGSFVLEGRRELAHRASWILHKGRIPEGLHVLHRCDNPRCVNPAHLFLGTHLDNMRDRDAKGRGAVPDATGIKRDPDTVLRGEEAPAAKLTEEDVRYIKASGATAKAIARDLGVSHWAIYDIRAGRTWTHV